MRPSVAARIAFAAASLGVASLGVAGSTVATESAASSARADAVSSAAPNQVPVARQLVAKLSTAQTDSTRVTRLLEIARSLNIGVYQGDGRPLIRGAERRALDFYFYDFDLRAIASALGRKQTADASDAASALNTLVSTLNENGSGPPLDSLQPSQLTAGLTRAVRASLAHPRDPTSLLPLIVRELGLHQKPAYDLAKGVAADRVRFDALQKTLLVADASAVIASALPKPSTANVFARANIPNSTSACNFVAGKGLGRFGKLVLSLIPAIKAKSRTIKIGDYVKVATLLLDIPHAMVLATLLDFQFTTNGQVRATHYGPPHAGRNADPGGNLQFQVGLQALADMPEGLVKCGLLVGLEFPKRGPVAGVPIDWTDAFGVKGYELLRENGTIIHEDAATGPDGIATLVFKPKDEVLPGFGPEHDEIGYLLPSARFLSAFGSTLGYVSERVAPMIARGGGFVVTRHKPRGFRFEGKVARAAEPPHPADILVDLKLCGDDPFAGEFFGRYTWAYDDAPDEWWYMWWPFTMGTMTSPSLSHPYNPGEFPGWNGEIVLASPTVVRMKFSDSPEVSLPLKEATDCPEN